MKKVIMKVRLLNVMKNGLMPYANPSSSIMLAPLRKQIALAMAPKQKMRMTTYLNQDWWYSTVVLWCSESEMRYESGPVVYSLSLLFISYL